MSCEFYTSTSRIANLLQNCEIGRCNLGGESGTISLLSVKFLSMADDVLFRVPSAKVEEMKKTFRDNGISDADILSFRDCLESDLKRKNMWEQLEVR